MQLSKNCWRRRGAPICRSSGRATPIRVQVKIREGEKERLQAFEGVVIARSRGAQPSFTVRKMSFGQGVERIFPVDSKVIDKIELVRSAKVRRAKLYYLRELRGKAARLKEVEQQHTKNRVPRPSFAWAGTVPRLLHKLPTICALVSFLVVGEDAD